ncbi:MAG: efflux RND transporter periplasmic adaptor subunit [Candidatus Gastranaerophilales bacterium]|nr:efflux RND transporter periplasmic adaptor subunit [Candidatus Gastranaerophilales bacterium]
MKKKIIAIIVVLLLICSCLYFIKNDKSNPNELTLFGNIEIRQVDMSFQAAGQILEMLKEEGDSVSKGELIAILDDRDYKSNLDKAEADVLTTLALKNEAQQQYDKQLPLCADNTISKQDCDTLLNTKDRTAADYNAASAQRDYAQNQYDYTKMYAPDDGIVTVRVQEPGATVTKGQSVYTISKNKPVWIRAYVNETDLGNIAYGMKAKVLTDSKDPKTGEIREYDGYIGYISPVSEFTPKTVQTEDLRTDLVYRIRVYVDEVDEFLRQGMPTTIKINLN